ncbi:MAG: ribbon-helix-helix protein, CopG family [Pseudonocardiaceae bacterium]
MKTTLNLDDDLMQAVREHARRRGLTLTELVSDALRKTLAEPAPVGFRLDLPITRGRRPPRVDVDSTAALEEYLDRAEQPRNVT